MSVTDGIAVVAGSPARLARALTDRDADTPVRPGAWTAGEYLWHLVDVLRSGEERFRTLALDPSRGFAAWDENELARARGYRALSPVVGLEAYERAARAWVEAAGAAPSGWLPNTRNSAPSTRPVSSDETPTRCCTTSPMSTAPSTEGPAPFGERVAGLDGCRGGWVLAVLPTVLPANGAGPVELRVVEKVEEALALLDTRVIGALGIDMPIGLAAVGPRRCDLEARRLLGRRASSVFSAPVRCVLGSGTYDEACERSAAACGKRLSRQSFNLLAKIEELDHAMDPRRQRLAVEVHPELVFAVLAGGPMSASKRTGDGRAERCGVLRPHVPDVDDVLARRLPGAQADDMLDALAVAVAARRFLAGTHLQLGGELDERGLRMEIVA